MSIIVTVHIDADPEHVQGVEDAHPEIIGVVMTAAQKYMTGHRRTTRPGHVLDLDEFASVADYEAFIAEAGGAISQLAERYGVAPKDTLWTVA